MMSRMFDRIENGESRESMLNYEWARLETFKTFPRVPISALHLAANCFYYTGQEDKVRCFICSLEHSGWKEGDVPSEIHSRLSPTCEFVRGTDGSNVPIHDRQQETEMQPGVAQHGQTVNNGSVRSKFPEFADETKRAGSFQGWPVRDVYPKDLSNAGFFYTGTGDCVRCFSCGGGLRDWTVGDDPWIEHARWFHWCPFLQEQKGEQLIRTHSNARDSENTDYNESEAQMQQMPGRQMNKGNKSERGDGRLSAMAAGQTERQDAGSTESADSAADDENGRFDDDQSSLKRELMQLKENYMCKICMDAETNIVFLPCSHMVVCQSCAPHITKCVVCRANIKHRQKIFIS